jgi:uncharacterized protein YbaA (DUF1428 family)
MNNEMGSLIRLFVWRTPNRNHDAMIELGKPANELFKNIGVRQEIFQLEGNSNLSEQNEMAEKMGFTNIATTVSANKDEEVWLELQFYRDKKHLDDVSARMQKDENAGKLGKQFMDLISPGSCVEGWFSHLSF